VSNFFLIKFFGGRRVEIVKQKWQLNSPREKTMRIITAILFVAGIFWALFAWLPLSSPIGMFFPIYKYTTKDIWISLLGALLAATGYWIWLGWLVRSLAQRYLLLSPRTFWILVALNHLGWMLSESIPGSFLSYMNLWSFGNIWLITVFFIAILICAINPDKDLKVKLPASSSTS
jgi:hypothetical protein